MVFMVLLLKLDILLPMLMVNFVIVVTMDALNAIVWLT